MGSIRKRPGRPKPYEARCWGPDGRQRSRSFAKKHDADTWLATQTADAARGQWIDPTAGKVPFGEFARQWLEAQTFEASTREAVSSRLHTHILPTFGKMELRAIRPSSVQAWLRGRQQVLAPSYVRVLLANVSAILGAAVEDGFIASNPCRSKAVRAPAKPDDKVKVWPGEWVDAVIAAMPTPYAAVPMVAAGAGLRQGEAFGLAVDDVDFLGRTLHVRRQIKLVAGKPVLAPPKGGRSRDVPLADTVSVALAERLRQHPARQVELPWRDLDGEPTTSQLVFTTREGGPLIRNYFNHHVWKPALRSAEIPTTRENGTHALRHFYASVLLEGGVSIRALADYLGHADPGFTLRTYTHLMPTAEGRTREAVDGAFRSRVGHVWASGSADG